MPAAGESAQAVAQLQCASCGLPAKLQCPKCLELKLASAPSAFCSQDCFRAAWGQHKQLHKPAPDAWLYCLDRGQARSPVMPSFAWTGELRPDVISPLRVVPDGIPRPDYARTGIPQSEMQSPQRVKGFVRSAKQIEGLRKVCRLGREILDAAHAAVRPGVTTDDIDKVVHDFTIAAGAYPSTLNYFNFPKSVCTSVNEVVCHGIPDRRPLQNGDIINVDVSAYLEGYHGDLNETFVVGEVDEASKHLIRTAHDCLHKAIAAVKPGVRYRDLGDIISQHAQQNGLSVVKTFCGHGIGDLFHCAPNIPHYSHNKAKGIIKEGQTFTIEPMINMGVWKDKTWPDQWTAVTADGKRSAQFEHTLVVTKTSCDILTARLPTSPPLWWEVDGQQPAQPTENGKAAI